jgi:hypothetical protein
MEARSQLRHRPIRRVNSRIAYVAGGFPGEAIHMALTGLPTMKRWLSGEVPL